MQSRDFVYWLQGYFELAPDDARLDAAQVKAIKNHLALVFKHEIDPAMGNAVHQTVLNETHRPPQIGGTDPVTGTTYRC